MRISKLRPYLDWSCIEFQSPTKNEWHATGSSVPTAGGGTPGIHTRPRIRCDDMNLPVSLVVNRRIKVDTAPNVVMDNGSASDEWMPSALETITAQNRHFQG